MLERYPLPIQASIGQNCADLPPAVFDKYFDPEPGADSRFRRETAKLICARCAVLEECRLEALGKPQGGLSGIIGGVTRNQIATGRQWLAYELGYRAAPPLHSRPSWLPRSDAAETAEQGRFELDEGVER